MGKENSDGITLGRRIRIARVTKGWSQEELSDIIGVSRETVSHWERDKWIPRGAMITALAEELKVTTDYILGTD